MKKEIEFKVLEGKLVVVVELKKVESVSAVDVMNGVYDVLKIQGFLYSNNGKLLHTGNLSNYLPINDEKAIQLRQLWKHNVAYVYGTLKQLECIGNISFEDLLRDKNVLNSALDTLKNNNLLVDRGVSFGSKALVNPLPQNILDMANNLLVA